MADLESVHSKWHSLLECLHLLSEAKEPSPSSARALVEPLLLYWKSFEDWEALWSASEREGLPALVSALKKALAVALSQPAHCSGWLKPATAQALLLWLTVQRWQLSRTADWCTPKWRPLLDLLLAWLPSKVAGTWQDAAMECRLQEHAHLQGHADWHISVTVASLDMLTVLLTGGAGEWASPATVVQGVEEWLLVVDQATAEQGPCSISGMSAAVTAPDHLLGRMRILVQRALMDDKGRPWRGGKTAKLLAQKAKLLQALSPLIFHIPFGTDEGQASAQPDRSAGGTLPAYLDTSLLACPPLQPALLGLLTTSSSALQGLLHMHKLVGEWTLEACEELEQALAAAGDDERLYGAALRLRNVVELLSESIGLLCRLHDQQVKAGAPGTDITQAALYPGCAAAFRAVQLATGAVTALDAASQGTSSTTQQEEPNQDATALDLCYESERAAYAALVAQLWGLNVVRYGPVIGPTCIVTPATMRCLVDDGLLPTLRAARFALGIHGSPLAARLMGAALPALCRQLPWPGSFTAKHVHQHVLAIALSVVADHLEVLEGRPERLAELGQELAEVAAQLLAAQGRLLVLDVQGGLRDHVTAEFPRHWDMLLRLAKLVGRLKERELLNQRVFLGLGYHGFSSLYRLLMLYSMRPPMVGLVREADREVAQHLRQLATKSMEVIASLQLRDCAAATLLMQSFAPILGYKRHVDLMIETVHDVMGDLLETYPRIPAGVVAGSGLLVHLAGWVKTNLEALEPQGLGQFPQINARFNAVQQQLGRLVRLCCQAVDEAGGTRFLEEEQAIEAASKVRLRQLLAAATAAANGTMRSESPANPQPALQQLGPAAAAAPEPPADFKIKLRMPDGPEKLYSIPHEFLRDHPNEWLAWVANQRLHPEMWQRYKAWHAGGQGKERQPARRSNAVGNRWHILRKVHAACSACIAANSANAAASKRANEVAPAALGGPRAAAVAASLLAWQRRRDELLPRLQRVVQRSTCLRSMLQVPAGIADGLIGTVRAAVPSCALVREWAVYATGCCANPLCAQPDGCADSSPKWRCSACKSVLYCSAACAKQDWLRHVPVCRVIRTR